MSKQKITPDVVKKIEGALEERKPKAERRQQSVAEAEALAASDRRAGKDRRTES